jgi:hypothetical protein
MRAAWRHAHVRPLWENPIAHKAREGTRTAHLWKWSELGPLITAATKLISMAAIERRVLTLVDPNAQGDIAGTTTNLAAALQILMPGESARPHRHTMNAVRFVIDGGGASTKVDGRDCPMWERPCGRKAQRRLLAFSFRNRSVSIEYARQLAELELVPDRHIGLAMPIESPKDPEVRSAPPT